MNILTKILNRGKISGKSQRFSLWTGPLGVKNDPFAQNLESGQNFWKKSDFHSGQVLRGKKMKLLSKTLNRVKISGKRQIFPLKMTILTKFLNRVKIAGKSMIFSVDRSPGVKNGSFAKNLEPGQNFWKTLDFLCQNDNFDQILESGQNLWKRSDFHSGQVLRGQKWKFCQKS